jgi:glycosyltransferase involved in cell wall biosynthesis
MNYNSFISILISNYNKEKFLENCLKSVCSQNYGNYEIILFDDHSTDNSYKIIRKYKKVKLIQGKKFKNITPPLRQINSLISCFKKSKGNIICFLDSDDMFAKNKLKFINSYFKKNKKKNFVVNNVYYNKILKLNRINYKNNKWPSIFPTSCISVRRNFFKKFLDFAKKYELPNLEIDARMTIFSSFYYNDFNYLDKSLTNYIFDEKGISSKYKFLSSNWWIKRSEAFYYMKYILEKRDKIFQKSVDYYVTKFLSTLIIFFRKLTL